jgi:hypothetical protein
MNLSQNLCGRGIVSRQLLISKGMRRQEEAQGAKAVHLGRDFVEKWRSGAGRGKHIRAFSVFL